MDGVKKQDSQKEFWKDYSSWSDSKPSNNYYVFDVDTENDRIAIKSQDQDKKGRPLLEYEIDKSRGVATETMRLGNGT